MPKTRLSSRIKIAFLNVMEAIGAAASHLASNAKLRVNEINLESRRHEILTKFSLQAFEMWHNGVKLPEELSDMFQEISEIDDKLSLLRAQKYAKLKGEGEEPKLEDVAVSPADEEMTEPAAMPVAADEPEAEKAAEPEDVKNTQPTVKKSRRTAKSKE